MKSSVSSKSLYAKPKPNFFASSFITNLLEPANASIEVLESKASIKSLPLSDIFESISPLVALNPLQFVIIKSSLKYVRAAVSTRMNIEIISPSFGMFLLMKLTLLNIRFNDIVGINPFIDSVIDLILDLDNIISLILIIG